MRAMLTTSLADTFPFPFPTPRSILTGALPRSAPLFQRSRTPAAYVKGTAESPPRKTTR